MPYLSVQPATDLLLHNPALGSQPPPNQSLIKPIELALVANTSASATFYHHPYPLGGNKAPINTHPVDHSGPVATRYAYRLIMYRLQLPVYSIESRNWQTAHLTQINNMNRNILFMWLATVYQDAIEVLRQLDELQRLACRSEWDIQRILLGLKKIRLMQQEEELVRLIFLALELSEQYEAEDLRTALTLMTGQEVLNLMDALCTTKDKKELANLKNSIFYLLAAKKHNLEGIFTILLR